MLRSRTLALLLGCAMGLAGCGAPEQRLESLVTPGANVVLISLDTLRPDHLGCYGYERDTSPVPDSLAERSGIFDSAYSHSPNTIASHASMLTSLHPLPPTAFAATSSCRRTS